MNNIDELLKKEKEKMDELIIPYDMEDKLRSALDNTPKKKNNIKIKVVSIILALLLISYNADTLAFYAKKLVGYDTVMNGTLQQLNDLGKGQLIDKSYTFDSGDKVTLDGIMMDDNKLIVFYTEFYPEGRVDNLNMWASLESTFGSINGGGGHGILNDAGTEMRWVQTYNAPYFFDKSMKLRFQLGEEIGEILFKIDRNKAVGKSIKFTINKKIELEQRGLELKSLKASPTSTVLKGQIQNLLELGLDHVGETRFKPREVEIILIADGKEMHAESGRMSTNMKGVKFQISFDALPKDTKEIQLKLTSFGGDHDTNNQVKLEKGKTNNFEILDQEIIIEEVYEREGSTYIKFTSDESVSLSGVYLHIDGEKKSLKETIPGDYDKIIIEDNAIIKHTRTMKFEGTGEKLELDIQRIRFVKDYDMIIWTHK